MRCADEQDCCSSLCNRCLVRKTFGSRNEGLTRLLVERKELRKVSYLLDDQTTSAGANKNDPTSFRLELNQNHGNLAVDTERFTPAICGRCSA